MNCYKVKVKTMNSMGDKAIGADGKYLACEGGILWIFGHSISDVERVVDSERVVYVEVAGEGYVAE